MVQLLLSELNFPTQSYKDKNSMAPCAHALPLPSWVSSCPGQDPTSPHYAADPLSEQQVTVAVLDSQQPFEALQCRNTPEQLDKSRQLSGPDCFSAGESDGPPGPFHFNTPCILKHASAKVTLPAGHVPVISMDATAQPSAGTYSLPELQAAWPRSQGHRPHRRSPRPVIQPCPGELLSFLLLAVTSSHSYDHQLIGVANNEKRKW